MKIFKTITHTILIFCTPVLLLTLVIGLLANSQWLYNYAADKYGVADALAANGLRLSDAELSSIYARLIDYYNSDQKFVTISLFREGSVTNVLTPDEALHFRDVKGLIRLDYGFFLGTLVFGLTAAALDLFWWRDRRLLARSLLGGGIFTLGLLLVLLAFDQIYGFNRLFIQFHFIFFDNLFWSAPGNMLLLFPEKLFIDGSAIGFGIVGAIAVMLGGVGWWQIKTARPVQA